MVVGTTSIEIAAADGAQTIAGTINGGADGEGTIIVTDNVSGSAPDLLTFTGIVGGTNDPGVLNIGSATEGGNAQFDEAVSVNAITITGGDNASEDSQGAFEKAVTATTIVLQDTASGGATTAVFDANGAFTVAGTINGGSAGEGTISVVDLTTAAPQAVTFSGIVGGSAQVGALTVGTSGDGGWNNVD